MSKKEESELAQILDKISEGNPEIKEFCISRFVLELANNDSVFKTLIEEDASFLDIIPKDKSIEWEKVFEKKISVFGTEIRNPDVYAYSFLSLLNEESDNFADLFLSKYHAGILAKLSLNQILSEKEDNPPIRAIKNSLKIKLTPENLTESVGLGGLVSPRFWSEMCLDIIAQKNWRIPWIESPSKFLRKALAYDIAAMNNQLECPAEMFPYDVFWVDANKIIALSGQKNSIETIIEDILLFVYNEANGGKILFIDNSDFICDAGNGSIFMKLMTIANAMNINLIFGGSGPHSQHIEDYVTNLTLDHPDKDGFLFLAQEICENAISEHFVDCRKYSSFIAEKIWDIEDGSKTCNLVRFVDYVCSSFRNEKTKIPEELYEKTGQFADNLIQYLETLSIKPIKISKKHIQKCFDLVFTKEIQQGKFSNKGIVNLDSILKKSIFGQDEAIEKMHQSLIRAKANLRQKRGPLGVFLCLGASGTGKTYTAKQLQKAVYGNDKIIRLDMSEFADGTSVTKIFGASAGYIGYDDGAPFLAEVQEKPRSVVLIDEIEKAHELVKNAFLKIFDEGSAKNNRGEIIDFSQTIIIVTGNVGSEELQAKKQRTMAFVDQESDDSFEKNKKEEVIKAIKSRFSPEFLNRMTEIIIYNNLCKDDVRRIVEFELSEIKDGCKKRGCSLSFDTETVSILVEKSSSSLHNGGRLVGKVVRDEVETPLALELLKTNPKKIKLIAKNGKINFQIS